MTSAQAKKGISVEGDRQNVIKQMKVRTTLKTDKSWIQQKSQEDDEISSPVSPQLKSLEGRKLLWSPNPETKTDGSSSTSDAKEAITRTSSSPVQSSKRNSTYSVNETNNLSSSPQSSPPPSVTSEKAPSYRASSGYIIRGQPMNATQPAKSQTGFNGLPKTTITQQKSASLPRGPSSTGYKMSTEEYKKLAPYNVRNKSFGDLSDEETSYTPPAEQAKRTETASSILRNTGAKERSYVFSAAKRYSGASSPTENHSPFLAKKVQVQEEEESPSKKTDTPPKSEDTISGKTISSPKLNLRTNTGTNSAPIKPQPGKIADQKEESVEKKGLPQNSESRSTTTRPVTTRTESPPVKAEEDLKKKSESLPRSLASYLYDDNYRSRDSSSPKLISSSITETSKPEIKPQPGKIMVIKDESDSNVSPRTSSETQPTTTRTVTTRTERVPAKEEKEDIKKKSDPGSESLDTFLSEDANRFESKWKTSQSAPAVSQTSPARLPTKEGKEDIKNKRDSLDTFLSEDAHSFESKWKTSQSAPAVSQTSPARLPTKEGKEDIKNKRDSLDTFLSEDAHRFEKEWKSSQCAPAVSQTSPASTTNKTDAPKENSYSTTSITETRTYKTQTGPGKITVIRDESPPPKPAPRTEIKPKITSAESSNVNTNKQSDLISWSDLDNEPKATEKRSTEPLNPTVTSTEARYRIPTLLEEPKLHTVSSRSSSDSGSPPVSTRTRETVRFSEPPAATETTKEARHRILDLLDESEPNTSVLRPGSSSDNISVTTKIVDTSYESSRPSVEQKSERSISPRPAPRVRESTTTTVTGSGYKVPEIRDRTMLESSPASSNVRTTVSTTRSTDPTYTEYLEDDDYTSLRTVSSSTERITTTTTVETSYKSSSEEDLSDKDVQSTNKGILFVKEYVNTRESMKSPSYSGISQPNFSDDLENITMSSSNYSYSSMPRSAEEGPCNYCGREIKDCAKIILEHLNIYCHEYCFKCGICSKPMGDLIDSLFIHRNVVHCESCYEKLF